MSFKFFPVIIIGLATLGIEEARSEAIFTEFPSEEIMQQTGGAQVVGMSPNGRYIIGSTYTAGGFVYDVETGEFRLVGASGVADNGDALTGLRVFNLHNGETAYNLERPTGADTFLMTTGISGDGHVVTGTGGMDWTHLNPLCWIDGHLLRLPFPSTEEVGTFKVNGCRANGVSSDGSVIWGNFIANPNTNNLIIWERQEDGTYDYVDVWTDLYEPLHGWEYDYERGDYDFVTGPNPYCKMEPYAMSGDGKLILIRTQQNTSEVSPPNKVGIFHVETRTLELAPWSEEDIIGKARDFDSRGIANNGTVVGIARVNTLSDAIPFIMFPGEGPSYLNEVFPEMDRLQQYEDMSQEGYPYLLTVISEDARYIAGYSTDRIWYSNETGQGAEDFGFWGYVIDMEGGKSQEGNSAIEEIKALDEEETSFQLFTVDGLKARQPAKGQLYIKRLSSGESRKIIY